MLHDDGGFHPLRAGIHCLLFDVLAQQYDMATNNPYNNLKQYRYESYTGTIDGIWQKTYRIIANLNALLEVSDEKKAILHPTTYGIIKGEAIGLRAFLHFELLRIFGWGKSGEPAFQPGQAFHPLRDGV